MSEASTRLATVTDLSVLVALVEEYHRFEQTPCHQTYAVRRALEPLLVPNDFGRVWLIDLEQRAIGYIALCFGYSIEFLGRDAFIDEFFIRPSHRGKGIGKAVLGQIQAAAQKLQIRALHLEVGRANKRARRLYAGLGFESRERFILMSRRL